MNNHHPMTRSSNTPFNDNHEIMKKNPSPRRQTTRSITHTSTKDNPSSANIQIIRPVAVRPPSSDSNQTPYNLRSRTKLKSSTATTNITATTTPSSSSSTPTTEVIPSFTEKLSLDTPSIIQDKPVPPLTRAAAASAGVKIDSILYDESIKIMNNSKISSTSQQSNISTRSSTTRKRKASEDDRRPYLDLLKMKQVISC
jgi:hypothetical protein